MSRRRLAIGAGAAALAAATPALAAYVCHPDVPGTKRLTIRGTVGGYSLANGVVSVSVNRDGHCSQLVWKPQANAAGERRAACVTARAATTVVTGARRVTIERARPNVDEPDRIAVYDRRTGARLRSWPLFNRPLSLDVDGDTAAFTTAGRDGFYGLRLDTGQIGLIGVNQRVDTPQIDATGIVYQDDLYKRDDGKGRVLMKFVPRAAVERELLKGGAPIRTRGVVRDFAMDAQRVAIAVADPRGVCDRVLFWNVSWHYVSQLTSANEATCTPGHAPGGITDVALGGITAAWTTTYGDATTVLSANIIACREWVIARLRHAAGGDRLGGLAADRGLLAYAVGRHERELRGQAIVGRIVRAGVSAVTVADGGGVPTAVSADSQRIATLRAGGTVDVRTRSGRIVSVVRAPGARAIALRRSRLVVLTRGSRLDVYDAQTARRLGSFAAPAGARAAVDVHYGVAVVTAGTHVYAVDIRSGRAAVVATAPAPVKAEIEAPGIVYQFNRAGHGYLRLVPFAAVRASLG